jgi:hypothetical protein
MVARMTVTLHRCRFEWLKTGPCWRVERALTGQRFYPAIEFEDGTWYREESRDMEATIRDEELSEIGKRLPALVIPR